MEKIISKEEFDKFMSIKGEVRGVSLLGYRDYLLKNESADAVKKIEDIFSELGYSFHFSEIKPMNFYPIGLQAVILESIKIIFNYQKEKFQEIGLFVSKVSMVLRLFIKYFFSAEKLIEQTPRIWGKSYTVGDLKVGEYTENSIILKLENFKLHPLHGQVLIGYFLSMMKMMGQEKPEGKEIKSPFKGDEYYEFLLKW